ncbi:hypothetical protein NHX12_008384 [Muraenolepis orangiensis]|uniref:Tetratricopeptide repeat domain 12 n=1 Tax=Muraenolepis orangiensis TaxID=630683 RepID=A0A9Q0DMX5_9TELE|nr:hypothetical protein NHX12_008384 [Muraenolepis orangiensis]
MDTLGDLDNFLHNVDTIKLKLKGNEAYARQDYNAAVEFYSDGLAELRDMQPLYTNRAQAYIKLGKYAEAVSDCEWALKCNERCIKAYVHMGKAYIGLRKYKEARNCYEKIVEIEPGREKMAKEYLTQLELEEERERQELSAREELDRGGQRASAVPQLLEKLSRPNQSPLHYCRGLELLSQAIHDCTGQTLFRLNNGFTVINGNDTVRSCLPHGSRTPEVHASLLRLWWAICDRNDENQKTLWACPVFGRAVVDWLASEHTAVRRETLALLLLYSRTHRGRRMAVDHLDVQMLMKNLMKCITNPKDQQEISALAVLDNFASENRFCMQLRDKLTDTRAAGVLSNVLPQCSAALQLAVDGGVVSAMRRVLRGSSQVLAPPPKHISGALIGSSLSLGTGPSSTRYAMKTITACTAASTLAREELLSSDKRLSVLLGVLETSDDEVVLGNAALCLGHCLEVEGAARDLLGTDARHGCPVDNPELPSCPEDPLPQGTTCSLLPCLLTRYLFSLSLSLVSRHMHKLRELHGVEVLHSCMKLVT